MPPHRGRRHGVSGSLRQLGVLELPKFGLHRIRAFAGSISVRLMLGFVTILCVFGAALFIMLQNLDQVRQASEETRARQETRSQALKIGRLAQRLFFYQYDFIQSEGYNTEPFMNTYEEIEGILESLEEKRLGAYERGKLQSLTQQVRQMRMIFVKDVWTTKYLVEDGIEPRETLYQMNNESRKVLTEINTLNGDLGESFKTKLQDAELQARNAWQTSLTTFKAVLGVALVVSLLITYYTHRSIVDPVNKLIEGTKALAAGDLSRSIEVRGSREFRELAQSFNKMTAALKENQQQLIQSEKLASIGRLAAGVAHEINNPIAVILGYAGMMKSRFRGEGKETEREAIQSIEEEARQCKAIVESLLNLSRPSGNGQTEQVNPEDLVSEVLDLAQILQLTESVQIERDLVDEHVPLSVGRSKLRQIVLNIVYNALEELQKEDEGRLAIRAFKEVRAEESEESDEEGRESLVLEFADNGPGIEEEHLGHLFEPFFTTKSSGTGLGLAITYNIVRAHEGTIHVDSEVGRGTTFTVVLPVSREESPEEAPEREPRTTVAKI